MSGAAIASPGKDGIAPAPALPPPRNTVLVRAASRSWAMRWRAASVAWTRGSGCAPIGGAGTSCPRCCAETIGPPRSPGERLSEFRNLAVILRPRRDGLRCGAAVGIVEFLGRLLPFGRERIIKRAPMLKPATTPSVASAFRDRRMTRGAGPRSWKAAGFADAGCGDACVAAAAGWTGVLAGSAITAPCGAVPPRRARCGRAARCACHPDAARRRRTAGPPPCSGPARGS
ncbi:MAG: hypothetical protein UZ03_NOB001000087 [Nitrospira sp. OLB3]|nr:MAG: hypothetical protein UZ03_NOB001000087 [Nitrospira sp. OLB3]